MVCLASVEYNEESIRVDRIDSVVRAFALIQVADDFYDPDKVFDGYSDVMYSVFRDREPCQNHHGHT